MVVNLTGWLYILKRVLKSKTPKKILREMILDNCLVTPEKVFGAYCVNSDDVWNNIVLKDKDMLSRLEELKFSRVEDLIAYYEEIQYKHMRATYPKRRHTKG